MNAGHQLFVGLESVLFFNFFLALSFVILGRLEGKAQTVILVFRIANSISQLFESLFYSFFTTLILLTSDVFTFHLILFHRFFLSTYQPNMQEQFIELRSELLGKKTTHLQESVRKMLHLWSFKVDTTQFGCLSQFCQLFVRMPLMSVSPLDSIIFILSCFGLELLALGLIKNHTSLLPYGIKKNQDFVHNLESSSIFITGQRALI